MACTRIAITGKSESLLFNDIYSKIAESNEELADKMFNHFQTELFKKDFGNFVEDYNNNVISDRTDENGEPKLFYNETAKKHYYLNKDKEQVYFPLVDRGLRAIWSYDQINKIKSRLALAYFTKSSAKLDFNNIDFSEMEALPRISQFITKEIKEKVSSLEEEGEYFSALSLSESLNHIDELSENVTNFFKEMNIELVEDDADGVVLENEEEVKDPVFNQDSAERSTKKSVSTNVKLRLSLLKDNENLDPIWNEPTFLSRDMVYSALQGVLSDEIALPGEDIFNLHKDALNRILPKKPFLTELHGYLNNPDITENQKSEFSQAFNLIKNNHIVTQFTINKDKTVSHNVIQISDTGSKTTQIKEQWDENFQKNFLGVTNKLKDGSNERLSKGLLVVKELSKKIESFKKSLKDSSDENLKKNEAEFEGFVNDITKILKVIGVETSEDGFQIYLDNFGKDISLPSITNNLQTLVEQTEYVLNGIKDKYSTVSTNYSTFIGLSQTLSKLASAEAFMMSEGSDATIFTGGNQKWIYSYPSYLSSTIKQWKKKPEILIRLYKSGQYQLGSYYMGVLSGTINSNGDKLQYNSKEEQIEVSRKLLDKIDLGVMNQMSTESDYKKTTDLAYKDYLTDYINKVISGDFTRTTTQADKTTELQTKFNLSVSSYNGIKNGSLTLTKKTKKIFFEYFASEYHRILEANKEVEDAMLDGSLKLTPHYHYVYNPEAIENDPLYVYSKNGNAFKSQYFEKLSKDSKGQTQLEKSITDLLYTDGNLNFQKIERGVNIDLDNLFDEYLEENLDKRFGQTIAYLQSSDILVRNEAGNLVPNKIDSKILDSQYKNISELQKAYAVASDFMVNGLMQNIEYSKMFTGDVAFYKNMIDYKKRVPATYTDGLQLRVNEWNETFKIATIQSVMRRSPFYDKLVEDLGEVGAKPYEKINSADAQAWITPKRWKFLIKSLGKWTTGKDSHESVYRKMMDDSKEGVIYSQKELKLAAQPLKGVYFYRDKQGKPVYLKYSQAVMSHALVKGSDLERLFNKMSSEQIDEVITFDGVKVGSIEPTKIHDEDGNIKEDFKLNSQTLYNRGWKLQQDLPTKTFKDTAVGSQIQKNIFAGLLHNQELGNFELDGQLYTGRNIIDKIVETVTGLTNNGLQSLKEEFKISDDFKIGDISGFYNTLIDELKKRGGSDNVIKALKAQTTIIGIPQSSSKLFNIFAAVMNSRLVKIKTNGGSFIQMSNFGMNKTEAEGKGVRWSPLADGTTNEPYIYIHPETLRPTVKPGGVLISGAFLSKYIPGWNKEDKDGHKFTNEELFVSYNGGEPIISKKIQENIIGYRIPNQGLASNDALRIVGILPESSGDTIVAYTGITTKTGSDFDVDKMYIMFPAVIRKENSKLLEYVDYDGNNITKKGLQNRLIELYKSVLTNTDVHKEVMKPIDIDFMEKELNALYPEKSTIFMNAFDPEVDTKLRYSFLGGKAGVGQEANALVDISREGTLSLYDVKSILWGNHNELGESKFDDEFSEELSEKDLDYYVNDMVNNDTSNEKKEALKNALRKVKVGDSLTAILNAFVDIAKDPYISKGNWTLSTTNVGNMLLRLGAHPLYVINFLANPIIKQHVDFQKSKESLTEGKDTGDSIEKFKKQIVIDALGQVKDYNLDLGQLYKDYFNKLNIDYRKDRLSDLYKHNEISIDEFTTKTSEIDVLFDKTFQSLVKKLKVSDDVLKSIISNMKKQHEIAFKPNKLNIFDNKNLQWNEYLLNLEYFRNQVKTKTPDINFQINLLNTFKEMQEYSKNVRENVMVAKLDTDGMGKSHNDLFSLLNLKEQVLGKVENGVKGSIRGFETKFQGTTLEAYLNSLEWVKNVVQSNPLLFPTGTDQVQGIFNEVSNDLYGSKLTNEDLITKLSKEYNTYALSKFFDLSKEETADLLNDFPLRLKQFSDANKSKYFLLDELNIKVSNSKAYSSSIFLNNRKKSSSYETLFTNSWKDLIIDNPKLSEDLIKYSFATSGFQMNVNQFFTYIPAEYFIQKDINNSVNKFIQGNQQDFLDKFYLNNLTDKKLVKKVFKNNIENSTGKIDEGFIVSMPGTSRYYVELETQQSQEQFENNVTPLPKYYKLIGYDSEEKGVYKRIAETSYKLNKKNLNNYTDTNELVTDESIRLQSLVVSDRQKATVIPSIYTLLPSINEVSETKIDNENKSEMRFDNKNTNKVEYFKGFWNRVDIEKQTDKVFLFGDNTDDRLVTKYIPASTQAVIRGLPNAIGIDTKKNRGTSIQSYFTNSDFNTFKQQVDEAIQKAKDSGKIIVIPEDGIGTGKAMLKEKAPKLFSYLEEQLNLLKNSEIEIDEDFDLSLIDYGNPDMDCI